MNKRKVGALSREDMEYIAANVDRFSPAEIAKAINRNVEPVQRYIQKNRLGDRYQQKLEEGDKTEFLVLKELKEKAFYRNLGTQLNAAELQYFEEHWVSMVMQFGGDILPSEEMELKELIILEILKNREMAAEKNRLEKKDELEQEYKRERRSPVSEQDRDLIRRLREEILSLTAMSNTYIGNLKNLCERAEKMRKALHASRQDRAKDLQNSKIDFGSWLKWLDEYSNKKRVGEEMEILRLAKEKELKRLGSYHTYANKEVSKPILNAETVNDEDL